MGFLSVLGKVGKGLLGLGGVASGAAKGSADQRLSEGQLALQQQGLRQGAARDQFSADLASRQFGVSEQDRAKKNALLMALMSGLQDANVTPGNPAIAARMPQMTGGMRPSAMLGGGNREALLALLGAQGPMDAPQFQAPGMAALPTAGFGEKLLGGLGLGANILGALGQGPDRYFHRTPDFNPSARQPQPGGWGIGGNVRPPTFG